MTIRLLLCGAALALGFAPWAAEAASCQGPNCKRAAQPLQLNQFMKPAVARQHGKLAKAAAPSALAKASHGVAKKRTAESTRRVLAQRRAPAVPAPTAPAPVPTEAADAFAGLPPVPIVAADELNEIDRAAGPPTTDGSGRDTQHVQLVAAADYNAIDRQADEADLALAAAQAPVRAQPQPHSQPSAPGWFGRLWAAIQGVLSALAAMLGLMG